MKVIMDHIQKKWCSIAKDTGYRDRDRPQTKRIINLPVRRQAVAYELGASVDNGVAVVNELVKRDRDFAVRVFMGGRHEQN